jgi:hypothetical protein
VTSADALLAAYDKQMRGAPPSPPAGVRYERDGPLLRVVGHFRGWIAAPADVGVDGVSAPSASASAPGASGRG